MEWNDHRLQALKDVGSDESLVLDSTWKNKLWIPDINFKNAAHSRLITGIDNIIYFSLHNATRITLSTRLSLDLLCKMDFKKYPHDTQSCYIDIMSCKNCLTSLDIKIDAFSTRFQCPITTGQLFWNGRSSPSRMRFSSRIFEFQATMKRNHLNPFLMVTYSEIWPQVEKIRFLKGSLAVFEGISHWTVYWVIISFKSIYPALSSWPCVS